MSFRDITGWPLELQIGRESKVTASTNYDLPTELLDFTHTVHILNHKSHVPVNFALFLLLLLSVHDEQ